MIVLDKSDFRGRFSVTFPKLNGADDVVSDNLDSIELEEITKLFGATLAGHFIANPTDSIYTPIYGTLLEGKLYSEGLKSILLSLVYLRYQRGNYAMSTENGRVLKDSSTSTVTNAYVQDANMYTRAVDGWKVIQIYSSKNYPDFKGLNKKYQIY